jgi:hypothetical protein
MGEMSGGVYMEMTDYIFRHRLNIMVYQGHQTETGDNDGNPLGRFEEGDQAKPSIAMVFAEG